MTKPTILITLFLALATSLAAQTTLTIGGTISDAKNNEFLPFVNAALLRPSDSLFMRGATSDLEGHFEISDVQAGTYLLHATSIGYADLWQKVVITQNTNLKALHMTPASTTLTAVEISAKKPIFAMDGEKNLYNVDQDPSVQTGTAADVLRNAPGVEVDAEGNVTLRGVSSVDIWINDHPSNLNAESLKTYIKQMPANSIERIEVITNPSARYASKSGGGIINIITNSKVKRNEFFSFGLNAATFPYIAPWVSYVFANEKLSLNIFANYSLSDYDAYSANRHTTNDNGISIEEYRDSTFSKGHNRGAYIHASLDYQFDTMNSLSAWIDLSPARNDQDFGSIAERKDLLNNNTYSQNWDGYHYQPYTWASMGAWYEHKFNSQGHKLTANFSGQYYKADVDALTRKKFVNLGDLDQTIKATETSSNPTASLNLDYTVPYSKNGEIQIGTEMSTNHMTEVQDYLDSTATTNGNFEINPINSYSLVSQNNSIDGYITIQHRFGNFTVKGGLRAEYDKILCTYDSTIQTTWYDCKTDKGYFNLRPSIHFSYRTQSMHNFNLSYSRHIATPFGTQLNRFRGYSDMEDSYTTGNPDLKETYTNSFEGGWTKYVPQFGSIGVKLYHKSSINEISSLTDVIIDNEVFHGRTIKYIRDVNLGNSYNTGSELNLTYMPSSFMNIRLYANVFNMSYSATYRDEQYNDSRMSYSLRLAFWTKLWQKVDVFASANYSSSTISLFSERGPNYSINGGFSADFFDHKMSIYVNAQDIFNWMTQSTSTNNPNYESSNTTKWTSRYIGAGLVFRLGKMELESKAKQSSGAIGGAPQM